MSYTSIVVAMVFLGAIGGIAVAMRGGSKTTAALLRAAAAGAAVGPLCGLFLILAAATWGIGFLIVQAVLSNPRVHRAMALSAAGATAGVGVKVFRARGQVSILGLSLIGDWLVYFVLLMLLLGPAVLLDREDLRELRQ